MSNGLDLGKQVGPLPLGAWLAVVAGGLGLAWYINKSAGGSPTGSVGDGLTEPGTSGDSGSGGGQFIYDPPQTAPLPDTGYETNDQWARAAILHLLSEGKNPITATDAITRYITEQTLNDEQRAMVGLAITKLGPPPFLPANAPTTPTEPTTPTTPVPAALSAPKNLRSWGNGPTALTVPLQWDAVSGAQHYRVYRKGVAFNIGDSTDTKIQIGGLKPGTSYTFHVRAIGAGGKIGPASTSKTFKTRK